MTQYHRMTLALAAAIVTAGALGACKKGEYDANDSAAGRIDTTAGRTDVLPGPRDSTGARADSTATTNPWADAAVVSFATAANSGEIALGKLGETKATNSAVKAFARMMVRDHQQMLASTKQLGTKLNASLDTLSGDAHDLVNDTHDALKDLTAKAKGADWDKDFMDKMIDSHQKVLDKLQDAAKNNTNASVRSALEEATGKVQEHLTKAQDIKARSLKS